MFSRMKMGEYMKPELCSIFRLRSVAKNILLRSTGIHFKHATVRFDFFILVDLLAAILCRKRLWQGFSQKSLENPQSKKQVKRN